MKGKVAILKWLAVFWICCSSSIWAAPVESEKGKDEFVFLLPATGNGGLIVPGLSANLEPPLPNLGEFRNSRDSYGNPVPPYTAVESGQKVLTPEGWKFEIPSYASGITEIRKPTNELLPPLAAGTVPVDALLTPAVIQPSIELLPPLKEDEVSGGKKDVVTNEIPETPEEGTTLKPENNDKKDNEDKTPEEQPADKKYPGVKYTGGFGGPPGILGHQKEKGYFIKEKEEREKEEAAAAAAAATSTEKHDEEHTEASPPSITSRSAEETPETNVAATPQPSLGFNSVFSSVLPPVQLANSSTQTTEESSEEPHGTERDLNKPHTEAYPSAPSEDNSATDISATQQPIQPFSFPSFSSPTSQQPDVSVDSPTTPQPSLSFGAPQPQQRFSSVDFQIPQQPGLALSPQEPTLQSGLSINPPSPTFTPPLGGQPDSPFGSSTFQQPIPSFDSQTPQQSIPSFGSQPNIPQSPDQSQQPIPTFGAPESQEPVATFGAPEAQQPIPSFGVQEAQQPIPSFGVQEAQQPIPTFGAPEAQQPIPTFIVPVAQQPISTFNFPPTTQQLPTFNVPSSIPERFDDSEKPQQQPGLISPPISNLTPPNPTPNVFGFAQVAIPATQPQPELPSFGIKANVPGKYTGGFGGAPGVLGNQPKPGYAVRPDGSIRDPDHAYKPPQPVASGVTTTTTTTTTTKAPIIVTPVTKYDKYTGGFGGPPGVLKPFDTKH